MSGASGCPGWVGCSLLRVGGARCLEGRGSRWAWLHGVPSCGLLWREQAAQWAPCQGGNEDSEKSPGGAALACSGLPYPDIHSQDMSSPI